MVIREAKVSGSFYPKRYEDLLPWIQYDSYENRKVLGALSPHAGYIYSGSLAKKVFGGILIPSKVLLLNPNHTGLGKRISLFPPGEWRFPGFSVPVNKTVAEKILKEMKQIDREFSYDTVAHREEHSGEVIVPFLYGRNPRISLIVLTIGFLSYQRCVETASALYHAIEEERDLLLVMSSDMTHYEPAEVAEKKDREAMKTFLNLDAEAFYNMVVEKDLTICGFIPITIGLLLLKKMGAKTGFEVGYTNSGVVTGDFFSVVAYAGYWFY